MVPRGSGENLMIISGGLIKVHAGVVGFAVPTTARLLNGSEIDFVAARLNDHWLLKAAGGESAVKGFCRDSNLLTLLKDKLTAASDAKIEEAPAAVVDEEDPMAKLKRVDVTPPPKRRKIAESAVKSRLANKQQVFSIRMPKHCQCAEQAVAMCASA